MRTLLPVLLALIWAEVPLLAQDPFSLAGATIQPGSRQRLELTVGGVSLPVSVVHGARPGPVLTLTAGIHGDEYPSVLALQTVAGMLKPEALAGTVVIVHLANPQGFFSRTIARNPIDGKNLNRVFPGKAEGSITEQIAAMLTREIVTPTDYLIDFHSGSANSKLMPHAYSPTVGNAELDARTVAFARATGFEHIVIYGGRPRDPANSISYPNTGQTRGKPSLTLECGQLGQVDEACVRKMTAAALGVMRHLKMLPGPLPRVRTRLYTKIFEVASPATGIFHASVQAGQRVKAGDLLGYVDTLYGDRTAELRSPEDGTVLYFLSTPPVNQGEDAVTLAR